MYNHHRGLASEIVLEPDSDPIPRRSAVNLDSVVRAISEALEIAVDCRRRPLHLP
jgi:mRNA interferase MazF